ADNRLPIARLQQQTPALNAEDDVYTNHIHADDLARAAHHAARWGLPNRSYNIVDNSDLKMGEYLDLVATHLNLPKPPRISRSAATHQLPAQNLSFMQESRRISNLRIKQEWGFRFRHPTVSAFLQETMPIDTHEGNH
ncbi:MAG: SDR family NAD(P)-dependent oxidoreductase, partial [Betaproteobacteria bacterium]|nr:SDR family NAD(P)-dependent oxidoreductase [Betaproteobacteria bacterium]